MESRYIFKSDPNQTFQLMTQPFQSWAVELYAVMQDQPFLVGDIINCLGLTGDEAMSLITYMFFDIKCIKLAVK